VDTEQLDKVGTLKNYPINPIIASELKRRGIKKIESTSGRNVVLDFERNDPGDTIFDLIYSNPVYRLLIQFITLGATRDPSFLPINIDELQIIFNQYNTHIKNSLITCPERNIRCHRCSEVISYYDTFLVKPSLDMTYCPNCRKRIVIDQCREEDNWDFLDEPYFQRFITPFLRNLVDYGILNKLTFGNCLNCHFSDKDPIFEVNPKDLTGWSQSELIEYISKFYCPNCGDFFDFIEVYDFSDVQKDYWIKNGGHWFEWYVKKMIQLSYRDLPIEQGIKVIGNETNEIDVIAFFKGKIVSFQCKVINPRNISFNKVADVLNLLDFSDKAVLITTSPLSPNDEKRLLKRGEGKVAIISAKYIERDLSGFFGPLWDTHFP